MLTYTVYSEAGGVGKTTLAANLAVAHRRAGLDVLVVPLDQQDGNLSRLFGVDDRRADGDADSIVHHMVGEPRGSFSDLVREVEGIDVVPEHNRLEDLAEILSREQERAESLGEAFNVYGRLQHALVEADAADRYDVVICDPPGTAGMHLYNALYATRNLVLPVEASAKGEASVEGLEDLATNFGDQLGIDIGVLTAVPNGVKGTADQEAVLDDLSLTVPETVRDRTSLFEGAWRSHCSAFEFVREHRSRRRDYEIETLAKLDRIARHLEAAGGVEAPSPPEPGALDPDADRDTDATGESETDAETEVEA